VPEHYVPTFKFSKDFKQIVDKGMKLGKPAEKGVE